LEYEKAFPIWIIRIGGLLLSEIAKGTTVQELAAKVEVEFDRMLEVSRRNSWAKFGKKIWFYAPTFAPYSSTDADFPSYAFPSISVTGNHCALGCLHCKGKLLNTMIPVSSPENLVSLAYTLKEKGSLGFLLSGGCLPDGSVPIEGFLDAIAEIKREVQLTVLVHTGLINLDTAKRMKEAGVDGALIDVIGSDETINEIYNLKEASIQDYERSLDALHRSGVPVIPHILLGLHYGEISGELEALDMISRYSPAALVIIVLRPLRGTPMATVSPPPPREVTKFIATARLALNQTPMVLGCVRPLGTHKTETDQLAIMAGINGVVFPSQEALKTAETLGLEPSFSSYCCAHIFLDAKIQSPE
jgi:uncharacterized radical SAM superfamily protein